MGVPCSQAVVRAMHDWLLSLRPSESFSVLQWAQSPSSSVLVVRRPCAKGRAAVAAVGGARGRSRSCAGPHWSSVPLALCCSFTGYSRAWCCVCACDWLIGRSYRRSCCILWPNSWPSGLTMKPWQTRSALRCSVIAVGFVVRRAHSSRGLGSCCADGGWEIRSGQQVLSRLC